MSDQGNKIKPSKSLKITPTSKYSSDILAEAIIESRADTKFIKNDMLPPLIRDTREARDKAREALQKVDIHIEDDDSHEHPCVENPRQERQDTEIAVLRDKATETNELSKANSKLVWWLMGLAVTVALIAGGFAISVSKVATGNSSHIETNTGDIDDNDEAIKVLRKAQRQDRELYLKEVRQLPNKVRQAAVKTPPTIEEIEDTADDLHLTEREQRQFIKLLKRARNRSNGHKG